MDNVNEIFGNEKENSENVIEVHVYGIPGKDVILCSIQKDKQLLEQLVKTVEKHLHFDHSDPIIFMHKGIIIEQIVLTAEDLKIESKDQILAMCSPTQDYLLAEDLYVDILL